MGKTGQTDGADHVHCLVHRREPWRDMSMRVEKQKYVEKIIRRVVWGKWNKERQESEKEPKNLVLLLRFTMGNFPDVKWGFTKLA